MRTEEDLIISAVRLKTVLYEIRTESDYDDLSVISKASIEEQIKNAELFLDEIKKSEYAGKSTKSAPAALFSVNERWRAARST